MWRLVNDDTGEMTMQKDGLVALLLVVLLVLVLWLWPLL